MTNLLWTLLSALWIGALPDIDPIASARLVGILLHCGSAALLVRIVGRETGKTLPCVGVLLLFVANGNLAFYAMSGLETPLWVFLFILSLAGLQTRSPWVGTVLGGLAMTRPEGVLVGALPGGVRRCCGIVDRDGSCWRNSD